MLTLFSVRRIGLSMLHLWAMLRR